MQDNIPNGGINSNNQNYRQVSFGKNQAEAAQPVATPTQTPPAQPFVSQQMPSQAATAVQEPIAAPVQRLDFTDTNYEQQQSQPIIDDIEVFDDDQAEGVEVATAAFICAILGMFLSIVPPVALIALPLSICGMVFGAIDLAKDKMLAWTSVIFGFIGVCVSLISLYLIFDTVLSLLEAFNGTT